MIKLIDIIENHFWYPVALAYLNFNIATTIAITGKKDF